MRPTAVLNLLFRLLCGQLLFAPLFAQSEDWLALLHYSEKARTQSSLDSPTFFLTPEGRQRPAAEYAANLKAMAAAREDQAESEDPRCLFPARARFFEKRGLVVSRYCPRYAAWKARFPLRSISLVYSSAYTGNAASMFGHTLLKLNLDRQKTAELLDYGLGFMAAADPSDGALYMFKGLFGGYSGFFTLQPYYELVNLYAYSENRDLWELEVPLDSEERELFLAHVYELTQRGGSAYYFTHVNCSSMLAEIIDAVKPNWHLRSSLHGMVMPSEVMRLVGERVDREAMQFRPSQRRLWSLRMAGLDPEQRKLYRQSWKGRALAAAANDPAVLDTLLDRIMLEKSATGLEEQKTLRDYENHVLQARAMQAEVKGLLAPRADNNPLDTHAPRLLQFTQAWREEEPGWGLRLRWGWHDLLDPGSGFDGGTQLNYFDLHWQQLKKAQSVKLTVLEVWSLFPWTEDDPHWSWTLSGGLFGESQESRWKNGAELEGSAGLVFGWGRQLFGILPGLQYAQPFDSYADRSMLLQGNLIALIRWTAKLRTLIRLAPSLAMETGRYRGHWEGETRGDLGRDWQLSFRAERDEASQLSFGLGRTF